VKVAWIIRQKQNGQLTNALIARSMGVSEVWVKKLWARYRKTGICELGKPGRPRKKQYVSSELKRTVMEAYGSFRVSACYLERLIELNYHIHIPHNTIHSIMKENGIAVDEAGKRNRRKWVRYERTYSNSLWHADWKQLKYGRWRWLICYMDDASRYIVGYGVFKEPTSKHALEVLHMAIGNHGKPASILTDRGTQFYATESEYKEKGITEFEEYLVNNDIRHILARVSHPQTNGKLERFYGEVERKLHLFKSVDELIDWWNNVKPHMSLNFNDLETPSQAYIRKMPGEGIVIDEQSGEIYHAKEE
jgi:putative transposase